MRPKKYHSFLDVGTIIMPQINHFVNLMHYVGKLVKKLEVESKPFLVC